MYKLILNGKLDDKIIKNKDELLKELANLDRTKVLTASWVFWV